ncbi:MAG TPA: Rap1a/Tai family immunity protein [Allosphingosinicella sp.]|nr:Rap1a/Tai family immunity protein [Allosphingosinicella sp.]
MKRIATTAMAAILLAGTATAQQPARQGQRTPVQAQRPPAQAQRPAQRAPAIPTRVTATTLANLCSQDRNACLAYVLGATDAFSSALVAAGRPPAFCFPGGMTNDQIAQTAVRYLRANPQEGGNNAGLVILAGLTSGFPCGY